MDQVPAPGPRRRFNYAVALLAILAASGCAGSHAPRTVVLKPTPGRGAGRRSIGATDVHRYGLHLVAGQYVTLRVHQVNIDLSASVDAPDGRHITFVDTPRQTTGDEIVEFVASDAGLYLVTIHPVEPDAPPGSYDIGVGDSRPATQHDRDRVAALRTFEAAEQMRRQATLRSIEDAETAYRRSSNQFQAANDRHGQAVADLRLAGVLASMGRAAEASALYKQSLESFREVHDQVGQTEALSGSGSHDEAVALAQSSGDAGVEARALLARSDNRYWGRKFADAKSDAERAASLFRSINDRSGVGHALRASGIAVQELDNANAALPLFRDAAALAHDVSDVELEIDAIGSLGWAYQYLGNLSEALASFTRAIDLSKRTGTGRVPWMLRSVGQIYEQQGQYRKALAYYDEALPEERQMGWTFDVGMTLLSKGAALFALGDPQNALTYFNEARDVERSGQHEAEEGAAELWIARVYDSLGQPTDGVDHVTRAIAAAQKVTNPRFEAIALSAASQLQANRGDYRSALDAAERALDVDRRMGSPSGTTLRRLGDVYHLLGDDIRARDYYGRALNDARRETQVDQVVLALIKLGHLDLERADASAAEQSFGDALTQSRTIGFRIGEANALIGVGTVRRMQGDDTRGVAAFTEAVDISRSIHERQIELDALIGLAEAQASTDAQTALATYGEVLRLARESRFPAAEGVALRNLMLLWRRNGQPQIAIFFGKQAINLFQSVRANILQLPSQTQTRYLQSKEDVYRELADLLVSEGRLGEAQQVLDFLKEQEFREYLRGGADATQVAFTPDEAAWQERYREIQDHVASLGRQRAELAASKMRSPEEDAQLARLDQDLAIAARAYQAFLDSVAAEFGARTDAPQRLFELREAQGLMTDLKEMGPGTVAVYTIVGETRYSALLITPDVQKAAAFPIAAPDMARKVQAFRNAVQDPTRDPTPLARELYDILVGPIAADLEQAHATTILWALDGVLRYVPLSALYDGHGFLVERYRTVVMTPASKSRLKDRSEPWTAGLGVGVSKSIPGFSPLPAVADELSGIIHDKRSGTSGVLEGHVLLDEAFTAPAFKAELMQHPRVVHVASHFQFQPGSETDSFLLLGDGHRLSVADLKNDWNLFDGVDLLTLSACNTAIGTAGATGKEVESFGVLAQRQGAKAVIATLWPVTDASTRLLMEEFYRERLADPTISKAEALRRAQLTLLDRQIPPVRSETTRGVKRQSSEMPRPAPSRDAYSHPYYWAPFLLIGNSR